MLDEAVGLALARRGIGYRTAAYCEWEAGAASLLLARMAEQSLEPCPVFCGDLEDFPAGLFAGRIDVVTAGYPCQPYSVAGKQRGLEDDRAMGADGRGPIHHMLGIIEAVRPRFVFLENVVEALKHFRPIGRELEGMGYTVAPPFVCGADDVGASHRRKRMFVLAYCEGGGRRRGGNVEDGEGAGIQSAVRDSGELADAQGGHVGIWVSRRGERGGANVSSTGGDLADAGEHDRRREFEEGRQGARGGAGSDGESNGVADSSGPGRERGEWRGASRVGIGEAAYGPASQLCEIPLFAPGPSDPEWGGILEQWPFLAPASEPGVCLVVDGLAHPLDCARADSLRAGGNGVVALAGALAFELSLRALEEH